MISVLFREAVMKKQLDEMGDYMVGLSQLAVCQPLPRIFLIADDHLGYGELLEPSV